VISRLSLTARLTALFSLVSAGVLVGLALLIGYSVDRHFAEEDYAALADKAALVRRIAGDAPGDAEMTARLAEALQNHAGLVVRLATAGGDTVYATPGFDAGAARELRTLPVAHGDHGAAQGAGRDGLTALAWHDGGMRYRAVRTRVDTARGEALQAIVGMDTEVHDHFTRGFRRTLATYVLLAALSCGVFGWWAARRGLAPLRSLASRAEIVTAQRLDERMPVDAAPVEIRELARKLNAMLERLQHDFQRLSEFSSDLAHELRTPITNLMTQTQVVLSLPREAAKYQDVLASNAEELQRLGRMVSDMLYLARVEEGVTLVRAEPLVLQDEVRALFDFYEALAEERGVVLRLSGQAGAVGDRLMLRRALGNLLSNALRYTPAGGSVEVRLVQRPGWVSIAVENQGQDIAAELLPSLFERFFRGDKSRVRSDLDGVGLGLSITRAIARAHGGAIAVRSSGGRTCFTLELPDVP